MPAEAGTGKTAGFVFFDVGGTLIEVAPSVGEVYARACRAKGATVDPVAIQQSFDRAWTRLSEEIPTGRDRYAHFPDGEDGWWRRICALAFDGCGIPAPGRPGVEELRALFAKPESWRVYPEARQVLATLRERGHRLGIISNWDSRLEPLLEALDLDRWFEVVVVSASAGCEKPAPRIFEEALRRAGVPPAGAVHIGDRVEEDYRAARACGLQALLVRRGDPAAETHEHVLPDLSGVPGRILP